MRDLTDIRKELDATDQALVALFERRMTLALEVAAYKQAHCLPVLDAGRETQVLASRTAMLKDPRWAEDVRQLYETIMALSRAQQEKVLKGEINP